MKRLLALGFFIRAVADGALHREYPSIGRFEGDVFDPTGWQPRVPTAAFLHARADDDFWAARRVAGVLRRDDPRDGARPGSYQRSGGRGHLADVLIKRRDKIGSAYLTAINPLVDFALDQTGRADVRERRGERRRGAAARRRLPGPLGRVRQRHRRGAPIGSPTVIAGTEARAPDGLPAAGFLKLEISAIQPDHPSWSTPIEVYFRRAPADGRWSDWNACRPPSGRSRSLEITHGESITLANRDARRRMRSGVDDRVGPEDHG